MLLCLSAAVSFNGAVTFSLRKYYSLHKDLIHDEKLQWGRNFFVTEIHGRDRQGGQLNKLQWGRNFFVTEIIIVGTPLHIRYKASMGP